MQLDSAANVARQALLATQQQLSLSGRNVAAAGDPTRSRVQAVLATTVDGGVRVAATKRAEDAALYGRMIRATSSSAAADAVLDHLKVLSDTVGDPQDGVSVSAKLGDLVSAISDYANAPEDANFGRTVIDRAYDVADALNNASQQLNELREQADNDMGDSVDKVNDLLAQFGKANAAVKRAVASGDDATISLDRRDAIVAEISQHMGVSTLSRAGGDMAILTDSGITLFDKEARSVTMQRTPVFTGSELGGVVLVDNMPVTGPGAPMPLKTGSIVGNAQVRDTIAPTYRAQVDEVARALEQTFADGAGSLFVSGGPPSYAATISVGAGVDPAQGGTPEAFRNGTGNPGNLASYSARLFSLVDAVKAAQSFDPATELPGTASLMDYASGSAGWLEGVRAQASEVSEREGSILTGASDALSRVSGVNLDDEYAQQLTIERNYQASAKLISVIGAMYQTLLEMV